MTDRPAILTAKVERLAAIISDGQDTKRDSNLTVDEARKAQSNAASEVLQAGGSVAAVKDVELPSERLQ
jgi:hypothetical protein